MTDNTSLSTAKIGILGLGYVGLPVAIAFAKKNIKVIGYDLDANKINKLTKQKDDNKILKTQDVKYLKKITFTNNISETNISNVYIVCVPTPMLIDGSQDLNYIMNVFTLAREKAIYVIKSTVLPGTTNLIQKPMDFSNELDQDNDLTINILPMIDVLFAVLLFFVLSSLILTRNTMVAVQRPKSGTNATIDKESIIISLNQEGELFINNKKTQESSLINDLKSLKDENQTKQLLIDADKTSQYGDVFRIIEQAKSADFESIGLVTNR